MSCAVGVATQHDVSNGNQETVILHFSHINMNQSHITSYFIMIFPRILNSYYPMLDLCDFI